MSFTTGIVGKVSKVPLPLTYCDVVPVHEKARTPLVVIGLPDTVNAVLAVTEAPTLVTVPEGIVCVDNSPLALATTMRVPAPERLSIVTTPELLIPIAREEADTMKR